VSAAVLNIPEVTVKLLNHVLEKLNMRDRTLAAIAAVQLELAQRND
jgi:DNA-binding NarL/FixJ family response regulator